MPRIFDTISSPNGRRNLVVDLTDGMEDSETIDTFSISTPNTSVLEITNDVKNANEISQDGITIAAKKGIKFSVRTLTVSKTKGLKIHVYFVGTSGSADWYELLLPIVPFLTK